MAVRALAAVFVAWPVAAQEPPPGLFDFRDSTLVDRVVAVVGDSVILLSQVEEELGLARAQGVEAEAREVLDVLVNFQLVLQAASKDTTLVPDTDEIESRVTLQLESDPGLSEVLRGQLDADAAIRRDVLPNLDVLPSGSETDNPSDLLNSRAMEKLLGALESRYNYVVIDSPPILAVTDAAVLAAQADGSVLVVRSGHTDQRAARRAMEQLHRVGVRVLGAVLNEVPPNVTEESYYFKYIYNYYERGSRQGSREPARTAAVR